MEFSTTTLAPNVRSLRRSGAEKWAWHQRTLLALRARLVNELVEHRREATAILREDSDEISEIAGEESQRELMFVELSAEENQLAEVDAALARLRAGTYGVCEETGRLIAASRLLALPWTRFSRAAAERQRAPMSFAGSWPAD